MKIKTFYARTMAEALLEIKASLGPDALILSTKPIARRSGLGGGASGFQVVAATDSKADARLDGIADVVEPMCATFDCKPDLRPGAGSDTRPKEQFGRLSDLQTMVQERRPAENQETYSPKTVRGGVRAAGQSCPVDVDYDEVHEAVQSGSRCFPASPALFKNATARRIFEELVANDVSEDLALRILERGYRSLAAESRPSRGALLRAVSEVAVGMLPQSPAKEGLPLKQVVVFVGPAGVGKTTVAAKLAANLALTRRKRVALFTLDTYRIGAVEQMRTYASLMALPFRVASEVAHLRQAISDHSQRDYILIDTPGRFLLETQPMSEMMELLHSTGRAECHLVLSATTKSSDMHKMVDWYEEFKPDYLLFTKLDETATLGPILNELVRTQKSLSFYTDGQRIPEDLHAPQREQIIEMVLNANSNGALKWKEHPSPAFLTASTKTRTTSRRARKTPRKSSLPTPPRRRKSQEQGSLP